MVKQLYDLVIRNSSCGNSLLQKMQGKVVYRECVQPSMDLYIRDSFVHQAIPILTKLNVW